ncbi:homeobox-leucine zipper protein hdg2 [Phtheirospermum japonicum]|uniref:Homeobox-leucine zipper protein hdg2 n=1 Tax=Phtheirospermum japonicum TaxID=374723 RepID=A0A830B3K0_9LAMI|nr:homeobox-leucine zipper protein hdg2 [Phtheirospermum japonicum]
MEPMQIKFWFQNKRTQMKTQHEHRENTLLRTENEKLRAENMRYREVLNNASCPACGGPTPIRDTSFHEQQLRIENARLREEIEHISTMTTKYVGKPLPNSTDTFSSSTSRLDGNYNVAFGAEILGRPMMNNGRQNEGSTHVVLELVTVAMEELMRLAQLGEPLWVPSMDRNTATLNEEEYLRSFSRVFGPKPSGFKSEASRETVVVAMSAQKVIEILVDVEQWSNVFSGVVSRASNVQVISSGVGGTYNEAIQVMNAEFQVPSPLVPTRESYFVRYCKQGVDGTWAVVDVSLDQLLHSNPLVSCRRRPSGCIVQEMPNGHSKIIWVEHIEVEDGGAQSIYKPLITAGLAFGAKRWVAILGGHCERAASTAVATNILPGDIDYLADQEGKKSMLKLAERMVTRFCRGVNASIGNTWSTLSGNSSETIKVMTRKNVDDPTMPFGIQLSVATSFWLPVPPKTVFEFLRDHHNRNEWDMLSNGGEFQEVMQFVSGNEVGNRIAVYQVKGGNSSQGEVTMLQESRTDPTASYIVYAPIDMASVNVVLGGGDPSLVPLLPSGFAILPDGPTGGQGRGIGAQANSGGSLLTIALQVFLFFFIFFLIF